MVLHHKFPSSLLRRTPAMLTATKKFFRKLISKRSSQQKQYDAFSESKPLVPPEVPPVTTDMHNRSVPSIHVQGPEFDTGSSERPSRGSSFDVQSVPASPRSNDGLLSVSPPPSPHHHQDEAGNGAFRHLLRVAGPKLDIEDFSGKLVRLGDNPAEIGELADVFLCETMDKVKVMVKMFRTLSLSAAKLDQNTMRRLLAEVRVWTQLDHKHVLALLGITEFSGSIGTVYPFMHNGNAMSFLQRYPQTNRLKLLSQVAQGLQYLHRQNIEHGDLRGRSILIADNEEARISDYGMAKVIDDILDLTGSPWEDANSVRWQAPELVDGHSYRPSFATDVYSFGCTMLEVLTDKVPFSDVKNAMQVVMHKSNGKSPNRPTSETISGRGLSDDVWTLLQDCWDKEPQSRPSMNFIVGRLDNLVRTVHRAPNTDAALGGVKNLSAEIKKQSETPVAMGGFCDVYIGIRLGKEKVAMKMLRYTSDQSVNVRKQFTRETRLWDKLKHDYILEFYGICDYGTAIYMISPWMQNGDAPKYLQDHPESRMRLLSEVALGLLYLHTRKPSVVHGDMKGSNILVDAAGHAKIADFGLAKIAATVTTLPLKGVGTVRWMAPELIVAMQGDDEAESIALKSLASDVYGYGMVMLELLSGEKPFYKIKNHLFIINTALSKGLLPDRPDTPDAKKWLNDPLWDFIQRLCNKNPEMRPTMTDVVTEMNTSWPQANLEAVKEDADGDSDRTVMTRRNPRDPKVRFRQVPNNAVIVEAQYQTIYEFSSRESALTEFEQ